jgi:hypothetical protein
MELAPVCRSFCRYAAVVFVGITAYTLVTKSLDGRLAGDWFHSLLHIGSAALAAYTGWGTQRRTPAVLFTVLLSAVYLGLGVFGWLVDGLFLGTPVAIPLGPPDNVFHLLLGGAGAVVLAGPLWAGRRKGAREGANRSAW